MTQSQKNRLKMFDTVHAFLEENSTVYSDTAEFVTGKSSFISKKEEINLKETERMHAMTGKTLGKNSAKDALISLALVMAGALFAFGKKTNDITLVEKSRQSKSKLDKLRDVELLIIANSIKELVLQNREALMPFGITPEKIQSYGTKIANYTDAVGAKESSGATKSSASKSLKQLFKEADDLLILTDKLTEAFRESNRQFYDGYKSSRVIRDLGVRHNNENKKPKEQHVENPVK